MSDEHYTPRDLYAKLDAEFGFTLDPCAVAGRLLAPSNYTAGDDGLNRPWAGHVVYMNPPYSQLPQWTMKAVQSCMFDGATVVGLYPGGRTEQPWWQQHVEGWRDGKSTHPKFTVETRFLAKRIKFADPDNPEGAKGTGRFPSVLVIWRPR